MIIDIWKKEKAEKHINTFMAKIYRIVEDQASAATAHLVDNVTEQGILEALLEETKPKLPKGHDDLHYLLKTPFRYPPLKYGSRFGTSSEPSLFYGALTIPTALAETAYYRYVYMDGMSEPYILSKPLIYTSFSVSVRSNNAIFLDRSPFDKYKKLLTYPDDYTTCQKIGKSMREANIEVFQFVSARDPNKGKNVALFTPSVFHTQRPNNQTNWVCKINNDAIGFISNDNQSRYEYRRAQFCVDGILPIPAT